MKKVVFSLVFVLTVGVALSAAVTLTLAFQSPEVECAPGGANVSVDYTIGSTAASPTTVVETLTDANGVTKKTNQYIISGSNVAGGWIVGGRTKTFDATFQAAGLADGEYSLEVCVTQAGSDGNPDKQICQTTPITVNCWEAAVNPCANTAPFGEVVGNTRINPNATAQIQFQGDFGPGAMVEITDASGFYRSAYIERNGDSCTYHANWKFTTDSGADFYGNNGAGVYTVKVTGNGKTLEFSVTLS